MPSSSLKSTINFSKTDISIKKCCQFLLDHYQDGWWPYRPGNSTALEATAWCAIALAPHDQRIMPRVLNFLISKQNIDGGWSTTPAIVTSDWCTGPVLLALRLLKKSLPKDIVNKELTQSMNRALNYLFDARVEFFSPVARLLILMYKGVSGLHYGRGWPWTAQCFHWVEPTSYTLMALKTPFFIEKESFRKAIEHANGFLIEHSCASGGWNHGANKCLGQDYPPYTVTTAEALLALQDMANHPVVDKALQYLISTDGQDHSAMSLSWKILALNAYKKNTTILSDLLIRSQNEDGSFGPNLLTSAISLLALTSTQGLNPLITIN